SPTRYNLMLVIHADQNGEALPTIIRSAFQSVDPGLAPPNMLRLADGVEASIGAQRLSLYIFAAFAVVALILAAIGIYGVIAYTVSRRTKEIGVRMALGAQVRDIINLILRQAGWLIGIGLVIGLAGAFAGARLLRALVFGVGEFDLVSIISVTGVLAAVGL